MRVRVEYPDMLEENTHTSGRMGGSPGSVRLRIQHELLEMASAVADALRHKEHLMVEAGTGVGKTVAYLTPAVAAGARPEACDRLHPHYQPQKPVGDQGIPLMQEVMDDAVQRGADEGPFELRPACGRWTRGVAV